MDIRDISRGSCCCRECSGCQVGTGPIPLLVQAFPSRPGEEVIPFLEQPQPPSADLNVLKWDELDAWITPNARFFRMAHYQKPLGPVIDDKAWKLEITGSGQATHDPHPE